MCNSWVTISNQKILLEGRESLLKEDPHNGNGCLNGTTAGSILIDVAKFYILREDQFCAISMTKNCMAILITGCGNTLTCLVLV